MDEKLLADEVGERIAAAARKKRAQGRDVVEAKGAADEEEAVYLVSVLRKALGNRGAGRRVSSRVVTSAEKTIGERVQQLSSRARGVVSPGTESAQGAEQPF